MNDNWKLADKQFTISPEALNALQNSHTDNLRESLKPRVNYELFEHNKIDDIKSELKTQNYLAAEQLDELANANRQLKEEKLMLEGKLDTFREQNEELLTENRNLNNSVSTLNLQIGEMQKKHYIREAIFVVVTGVITWFLTDGIEVIRNLLSNISSGAQ